MVSWSCTNWWWVILIRSCKVVNGRPQVQIPTNTYLLKKKLPHISKSYLRILGLLQREISPLNFFQLSFNRELKFCIDLSREYVLKPETDCIWVTLHPTIGIVQAILFQLLSRPPSRDRDLNHRKIANSLTGIKKG